MAEGYVMTIPKTVLEQLDLVDAKITKIAQNSERTRDRVRISFEAMANGIDPFLQKLQAIAKLKNINFNKTFENASTAAEKAAGDIAKVATELNKMNKYSSTPSSSSANTSVLAWQGINENLKIQQARLDAVNRSIKEYENTLARINSGKGGSVSTADQTAYQSNLQEAQAIQKTIAAYELKQQKVIALQQAQREQLQLEEKLRNLAQGKTSFAEEKQAAELAKLNEAFRTGQSEIQKRAKLIDEYRKSVEAANKADEKRIAQENRKASSERAKSEQQAARAVEQYNRALNKSELTIIQRTRKIEALANAQRALTATGRNYSQQISTIASETRRLQVANANAAKSSQNLAKEQSKILDTTQQLKRQFALLFSVSAIEGYFKQLVSVRGEFELQQRALQSILQNKDQANEVWDKTVQLAVRSPFTVKELVTYTKQLAAYRIEADKLYDTNKMLADVSAGLGVSMDRLILAFGQVKAANYLRASEVRQFTEAGVNILGELAAIYTELEGKMVSVGDVQERITKRMVKFGDVEEVFKRITSAGGIFYNMQEVQAETLAGMMSNLRDTFDLMFNEIGKANDGILKYFVTLLKDIVNSWETIGQIVIPIIGTLTSRFLILKAAQMSLAGGAINRMFKILFGGFQMMGAKLTNNIRLTTVLAQRMKMLGTTSLGGWTAALSAIVIIGWEVYSALSAARKEQEELNKIDLQGSFDASKMSADYTTLANTISDTTKSYEEQKEALDTLKRTYGEILPAHMLEADAIRQMKGNYDEATQSIYNYVAAKTKEKKLSKISETYGEEVSETGDELAKFTKRRIETVSGVSIAMSEVLPIVAKLREEIEKGNVDASNMLETFDELIKKSTGVNVSGVMGDFYSSVSDYKNDVLNPFFESVTTMREKLEEAESDTATKFGTLIERRMKKSSDEVSKFTQKAKNDLDLLSKSKDNPLISKEQVDEAKKRVIEYFKWLGVQVDEKDFNSKFNNIIGGDIISLQDLVKQLDTASLDKQIIKLTSEFGTEAIPYIERLENTLVGKEGTSFQKKIHDMVVTYAKENKMSLNGLDKALAETEENSSKYLPRITQAYKDLSEEIKRVTFAGSPDFGTVSPEKLEEMKNLAKVYKMIIDSYPKTDKEQKKGKSEADKRLRRQLALLKEIGKAYKENLKYYNEEDAKKKTQLDYKDAAREAGIESLVMSMEFDPTGLIAAIEELAKNASGKVKLELEKAIANIKGEIGLKVRIEGIENVEKEIEDVFRNYEMTISLKTAFPNMDVDQLGKLFNFDPVSLEEAQDKINKAWIKKANEREKELAAQQGREARIYKDGATAAASLGEEATKKYKKQMDEITKYSQQELEKRLKDFVKFLNDTKDKTKKILEDLKADLARAQQLFKEGKIDAKEYSDIVGKLTTDADKEIGKENIAKFKDSPDYIKMIGDVSIYSKEELQKLSDQLRQFIALNAGKMDSNQLKSFQDDLSKINEGMKEIDETYKMNNPFAGGLIKQLKELKKARQEYNEALEEQKLRQEEVRKAEEELAKAEEEAAKLREKYKDNLDDPKAQEELGNSAKNIDNATVNLNNANGALKESNANVAQTGAKVKGMEKAMGGVLGIVDKIVTAIYQGIKATLELLDNIEELAKSRGRNTDKGAWREVKQGAKILGDFNEKVMSSWTKFKNKDFAGATSDAISGIIGIFTNLNKQHDARQQQKIEKEIKLVNRLSMAYQHLARNIENAYTIDTLNMSYKNAEENIKQQMESTQRMIDAEKGKKDQDEEQIAEWQDELIQQQEKLEDLRSERLQKLGGFGSGSAVADAAEEFVSAWMEAYKETGDGLDALNEKWDEFIQNLVVKQMALRVTEKFLKPVMDEIDKSIENDSYLSTDELAKIRALQDKTMGNLNQGLKDIMEGFGDLVPQPGSASELTGLQKGIQGITAEQAGVIEAYLNSIRFFVSDISIETKRLVSSLLDETIPNPILNELRIQTEQIRSINSFLDSVIMSGHRLGRSGLKVFLD